MLQKVLVSNRGEIACRIIRSLRSLGIASVALYHHEDRRAPHVSMADEAVLLNGQTPAAAYLDQQQILEACRAIGADAVHPGYGFLSENASFAEAASLSGLTFIGPDADIIRLMGDKIRARAFAAENGLAVAPSVVLEHDREDMDDFVDAAAAIGFPLLIKATAGGGGKGMKVVRGREELRENVRIAASEAQRYFGDRRIYAEKLIEKPRHIEVQVFGDGRGSVVHLHERECSLQRRYQKIVEEAPAPNLAPSLREAICAAAVSLASAARYKNAGTVEFILAADDAFYFLEMNTRLQVEHPVTELILGLDLVAEQIRIAAGQGLSFGQADIKPSGHAIECRICAERPEKEFEPATGRVGVLRLPKGEHIRADIGVQEGQAITPAFDSMLGKLAAHGATRTEAITRLEAALNDFVLLGVPTNIDYLARIMRNERFRSGQLDTAFLATEAANLAEPEITAEHRGAAIVTALLSHRDFRHLSFDVPEPYASMGPWRN